MMPLLTLTIGASCISFAAVFVKLLGGRGMEPTVIGFWRTFLGAVILFAWAALRRERLTLPGSVMGWSALAGFVFFLDLFFWHRSILYAGAGMATILANTQVFTTAILSLLIFKERLSLRFFVAIVSAIAGVALLIGWGSGIVFTARYLNGVIYGLLTGIVYAGYIVILKNAGQHAQKPGFLTLMAFTSLFSALFLGLAGLLEKASLAPPDWLSVLWLVILALVAQAWGWRAIAGALPRIEASRAGLVLLLQPVLATVWGVILFHEYLTSVQIIGAVITLTAIYAGSVRRR
ncbi:MAG: DMT family transporter [bacterium]